MSGSEGGYVLDLTAEYDGDVNAKIAETVSQVQKIGGAAEDSSKSLSGLAAQGASVSTALTKSASAISNKWDDLTRAENSLARITKDLTDAQNNLAAAQNTGGAGADKLARSITNLQAAQAAAQQKVEDLKSGANAATPALKGLSDQTDKATISSGQLAFASQQMRVQFLQFASGIATGQPILTSFIQQGHQVADVALSTGSGLSGLGQAARSAFGFLAGPIGVAAGFAAAGAGAIYLAEQSEKAQRQLDALSDTMRATRTDYGASAQLANSSALDFSHSTGIDRNTSRQAAAILAGTSDFAGGSSQMAQLMADANDLSHVMGTDLPSAAKLLSQAMEDPGKVADQLAEQHFPGFTHALVDNVQAMERSGQSAQAFQVVLSALEDQTRGASDNLTPLQESIRKLGDSFRSSGIEDFVTWVERLANSSLVSGINATANAMQSLAHPQSDHNNSLTVGFGGVVNPMSMTMPGDFSSLEHSGNISAGQVLSNLQTVIQAVSQRTGVSSDLLSNLQTFENRIPNGDGTWPTSSTGAIGPFQVMPQTFRDMLGDSRNYPLTSQIAAANQNDLSNPAVNSTAAGELMSHLLQKYGDPYTAVLAYHDGETVVDKMLKGQGNVSSAAVTEAQTVTGVRRHLAYATPGGTSAAYIDQSQDINRDWQTVDAINPLREQIDKNNQQQDAVKQLRDSLQNQLNSDTPGSDEYTYDSSQLDKAKQALQGLKDQQADMISSYDKLMKSQQQSADLFGSEAGAAREYAQALQEAQKANGSAPLTQSQTDAVNQLTYSRLTGQFNDQLSQIGQQTGQLNSQADNFSTNAVAMDHVNNSAKAATDALQYAQAGTADYAAKVGLLTDALDKQSDAQNRVNAMTDEAQEKQSLAAAQQQLSTAYESPDQQQLASAQYSEQQKLLTQGIDPNSQEGQMRMSTISQTVLTSQQTDEIKQNINEIGQLGDQVFSDLGQSIMNAFTSGNASALSFKNVVDGVLGDVLTQLTKLAVINPLENMLTNGNSPTLTSVLSAFSGASSSGAGSSSIASSASGLSGDAATLFGSLGGGASSAGGSSNALGSLLGSIGLGKVSTTGWAGAASGIGLGTLGGGLLGSLEGGSTEDSGLGSAAGSLAGAAIGSIVPVVGTMLGGILGGVLGGGIGGLFGGATQHNGWNVKFGTDSDGQVGITNSGFEGSSKDNEASTLATANYQVAQLDALMSQYGVKASGSTLIGGDNGVTGQATSFEDAMGNLVYSSTDAIIQKALDTYGAAGSLSSLSNMATVLANAEALSESVNNLSNPITTSGSGNFLTDNEAGLGGSIASQSASYWNNVYAPQLNEASTIGDTADYNSLLAGFNQIVDRLNTQATEQVQQTDYGYTAATQTANGQTFAAAQTQQEASAAQQREALQNELDGLYGTAYESTSAYADQMSQLNTEISAQAAALARQQALQTTSDLTNLSATNLGYQATGASALGQTDLAAQLQLQASQMTAMVQATQSLTTLLENGEITQAQYNDSLAQLTAAQQDQTSALAQSQALADQTSRDTYTANSLSYSARTLTAQGGNAEQAALDNFDANAATQVDQLQSQLQTMLDNGIIDTTQYYSQITQLDQTLAAERLAVQQQYTDAAEQQLTSQVSSLKSFLTGLESDIGTPAEQLSRTRTTFQTDYLGASAGNAEDFANLETDAQAFLAASKSANGTGTTAYENDVQTVIAAINSITGDSTIMDTLTTSTMSEIAETQTEKMVDAIDDLKAEFAKLELQLQQASMAT